MQHLAQPAASVQHLAQVAGSLQQAPVQALAADLQQPEPLLQFEQQPVVRNTAAAQTVARNIIYFMVVLFWWSVNGLQYQ